MTRKNSSTRIYIFWTCQNQEEATRIIHTLLEKRLIACASLFPQVKSIYWWQGKIEESREVKVILKTIRTHFRAIQKYIESSSSYETPEIVQVTIDDGSPRYLEWMLEATSLKNPLIKDC